MFRRFTITSVLVLLFTLVGLIPLVAFGLYVMQMVSGRLVQKTLEELKQSVLSDVHHIQHRIDMTQSDLPILSHVAAVRELIESRSRRDWVEAERWRKALEQVFLAFSRSRKVYHQIRYLDEEGNELVRVDSDGVHPPRIVPRDQLRNQRQRYYFSETMTLEPDQVFTSPMDLNRDDGQIEVPHRLVIRYATPLFDDEANRRGIVIINLSVGSLLEAL